jgi:hypothetical protein
MFALLFSTGQRSREHFNLLILLGCEFSNFVTLGEYKVKTP